MPRRWVAPRQNRADVEPSPVGSAAAGEGQRSARRAHPGARSATRARHSDRIMHMPFEGTQAAGPVNRICCARSPSSRWHG